MTRPRDIIIVGLPRSGTTLVYARLNRFPDVVALSEPLDVAAITSLRGLASEYASADLGPSS